MSGQPQGPSTDGKALRLLAALLATVGVTLVTLSILAFTDVLPGGVALGVVELGGALLAFDAARGILRVRKRAQEGPVATQMRSGTMAVESGPSGILMSGKRWVVALGLVGAVFGYVVGGDFGLAVIGGIAGVAVGALSVLMPLESLLDKDRSRDDKRR